jgi:transposase
MLSIPPTVRVFAAVEPVDLRKGFDGLACVVRQVIAADPLSGHLFVFFNRAGNRAKVPSGHGAASRSSSSASRRGASTSRARRGRARGSSR